MSVTMTDPVLLAQLTASNEEILVTDADGNHIGRFIYEPTCILQAILKSPFSDAQITERRKDLSGRKLEDILPKR